MNPRFILAAPPTNPLMQIVYLIIGTILVAGAIVMGAVILAFVFGIALVFGIVLWVRVWWLRRKFRHVAGQRMHDATGKQSARSEGGVEISGVEYHVVRETRRDDD